jgi:IS30 family transposase
MSTPRRRLTVIDRTMIEVRLRDGWSVRAIATALGRSPGTISDEIQKHSDCAGYHADAAETRAAANRRLSGRVPRLGSDGALFGGVAKLLRLKWSPEQISGRRRRIEGGMEKQSGLLVSHEATVWFGQRAEPAQNFSRPCGTRSRIAVKRSWDTATANL